MRDASGIWTCMWLTKNSAAKYFKSLSASSACLLQIQKIILTPCLLFLRSHHNYLRITRILKSLGELGYEAFKAPLVRFFLEESLCNGTLLNMQHSALEYYVYTIRLPAARRRLLRYARQHYRPPHAFLWGPPSKKRAGGSVGAGSSGIRAPAPTPEQQRRGEENTPILSSHDAIMCQELAGGGINGCAELGSSGAGVQRALMLVEVRGQRSDYDEAFPF